MPKKNSDIQKSERHHRLYGILKSRTNEDNALTVTEIFEILSHEVDVDRKTVQRDLEEMSGPYKLLETEEKPRRYFASADFTPDYDLSFNEEELQTLILSLENLRHVAPHYIENLIDSSRSKLLGKLPKMLAEDFARFREKLIVTDSVIGQGQGEDDEAVKFLLEALRSEKMVRLTNHSPYKKTKTNPRIVYPLFLNLTGGVFYLIAADPEDKLKIKRFRLSRLSDVEVLDKKIFLNTKSIMKKLDFSFGGYGTGDEPLIEYKIICVPEMGTYFKERRFNKSQRTKDLPNGNTEVVFKSRSSNEIIRFLAGFGGQIISLEPKDSLVKIQEIWCSGIKKIK